MSQYRTGTITTNTGNAHIVGTGTAFTGNTVAGDIFIRVGDSVSYEVGSVSNDTILILTAPYAGNTANSLDFVIARDFTPVRDIPYISKGDVETALILKRALMIIDGLL
jgi:hypothetical protein